MSDRTTGIIGKLKELEDDQYREPDDRFTPEQIADIADSAKIEIRLLLREVQELRDVLSAIAKPTYGTELHDTEAELASHYWSIISAFQALARKALYGD